MHASPRGGAASAVPSSQEHRQHRPGEQVQRSHQTVEEGHRVRGQPLYVTELLCMLLPTRNISIFQFIVVFYFSLEHYVIED